MCCLSVSLYYLQYLTAHGSNFLPPTLSYPAATYPSASGATQLHHTVCRSPVVFWSSSVILLGINHYNMEIWCVLLHPIIYIHLVSQPAAEIVNKGSETRYKRHYWLISQQPLFSFVMKLLFSYVQNTAVLLRNETAVLLLCWTLLFSFIMKLLFSFVQNTAVLLCNETAVLLCAEHCCSPS